ncbi:MAG: transposase [Patescibacteria group bacterium]
MKKTTYSDKQKAQIVLDAIKGQKTINQISFQYQIHPTQINRWKTIVLENLPNIFNNDIQKNRQILEKEHLIEELYKIIGQRDIELEWLKKKLQI